MRHEKTVCFTGRRPKDLYGYCDREQYKPLIKYLEDLLYDLSRKGYRKFISGGAQGFDQLAFWAVCNLKRRGVPVQNILYMPFKGQELRWKEDGIFSQQDYRQMVGLADEVKIISDTNNVAALFQRNHSMVDAANLVIALYPDKTWRAAKGGTAECMRYAEKTGHEILQICYQKPDISSTLTTIIQP